MYTFSYLYVQVHVLRMTRILHSLLFPVLSSLDNDVVGTSYYDKNVSSLYYGKPLVGADQVAPYDSSPSNQQLLYGGCFAWKAHFSSSY